MSFYGIGKMFVPLSCCLVRSMKFCIALSWIFKCSCLKFPSIFIDPCNSNFRCLVVICQTQLITNLTLDTWWFLPLLLRRCSIDGDILDPQVASSDPSSMCDMRETCLHTNNMLSCNLATLLRSILYIRSSNDLACLHAQSNVHNSSVLHMC